MKTIVVCFAILVASGPVFGQEVCPNLFSPLPEFRDRYLYFTMEIGKFEDLITIIEGNRFSHFVVHKWNRMAPYRRLAFLKFVEEYYEFATDLIDRRRVYGIRHVDQVAFFKQTVDRLLTFELSKNDVDESVLKTARTISWFAQN